MERTVYGRFHVHTFDKYTINGNSIEQHCSNVDGWCNPTYTPAKVTLEMSSDEKTYDGKAYAGASMTGGDSGAKLQYRVKGGSDLSDSAPVNVGTYEAVLSWGGQVIAKDFTITAATIDAISLSDYELFYNGSTQSVTLNEVTASGGKLTGLVKDKDYTVSGTMSDVGDPANNTWNTVTVEGKGNYTGTQTANWVIKGHTHIFKCTVTEGKLTVDCKGETACTIPGGTSLEIVCEDKTYDGQPLTATVKDNTTGGYTFGTYTQGGTYTDITWDDASANAGNHTASFKATVGGTEYTISKTFTIARKDISGATVTFSPASSFTYDGTVKTVTPSVTVDGLSATLEKTGTTSTKEINTYPVSVTGTGNFTGTINTSWEIKNVSGAAGTPSVATAGTGSLVAKAEANPLPGYTLEISDSTQLEYKDGVWYAGITYKFPHKYNEVTKGVYSYDTVQYTDFSNGQITIDGVSYTGEDAIAGKDLTSCTLSGTQGNGTFGNADVDFWKDVNYTYLDTITWKVKITEADVRAAVGAGKTELTWTATVGGLIWGSATQGDTDGVQFLELSVKLPVGEKTPKLIDDKGTQHYPDHTHNWTLPQLVGNCVTSECQEAGCPYKAVGVSLQVSGKEYDGTEISASKVVSPAFGTIYPDYAVGEIKYYDASGNEYEYYVYEDGEKSTKFTVPKFTGSYTAKLAVGALTIAVPFEITKPAAGYSDGWEVNNTSASVRYDQWEQARDAAADGDTVYYHGTDRSYASHNFTFGNGKKCSVDFGGKVLTRASFSQDMSIVNDDANGVLTLKNVILRQPRAEVAFGQYGSAHITTSGYIVFGTGVKVENMADKEDNYCTITVKSGWLLVADGLYQCGFSGNALVTGGKFWANDDPTNFVYDRGNTYVVRPIDETIDSTKYTRLVVAHAHHDAYSASANVITATCDAQDHQYCSYGSPTATLNAEDRKETGSAYEGASIVYSGRFPITNTVDDIVYYTADNLPVEPDGVPSLFGAYTATLEIGGATAEKAFAITLNADDPEVTNDVPYENPEGEQMDISVSSEFIAENVDTDGRSTAEIMAELNEDGANGIPKIESYVLGLDPKEATSRPVALPVQTSDADKLTLTVGGIDVKEDAGATVKYSVVTADTPEGLAEATPGEKQDTPTFELDLPTSGVKYYGIRLDLVNP